MSEWGSRLRVRTVKGLGNDVPGGSIVKAGYYFVFEGGSWVPAAKPNPPLTIPYYPAYSVAESCRDDLHPGPPWTSGGPFTKIRLSFPYNQELQGFNWYDSGSQTYNMQGHGYVPVGYRGGYGSPSFPSDIYEGDYWNLNKMLGPTFLVPDVSSWGPEAWAKTAPKIEMASGFVALAESRDLPRMMKQTSENFHDIWRQLGGNSISAQQAPKKASDAFLNHQFGWSPFLSDMRKFYDAYKNTGNYMAQMSNGNDQWRTYRRTLLNDFRSTKISEGQGWRVQPNGYIHENLFADGSPPKWTLWEDTSTLVTTSGQFKWYKPEFDMANPEYNSAWNNMGRQMTMYGVRISPSNVWRATPWTWLIDWGLNMGRNIDRITEYIYDGVVSKYLYVMEHKTRRLRFETTIPFRSGPRTLTYYRIIDVKERVPSSSPFGFSLPWSGLDSRKLAILAALGISRK